MVKMMLYMQNDKLQEDNIRTFFKKYPPFFYFIVAVFGPAYLGGLNAKRFLEIFNVEGKKINLGSGPRRLARDVINVDIEQFEGVDIVSDITKLPFADASVSMIVCDNVLEHVENPDSVLKEIYRILIPSGVAYISTPFLYPFHSSPSDYTRWTDQGLRKLCEDFTMVEIGARSGIFSAFNTLLCYLLPSIFSFGSKKFYWFLVNISLFLFFPIKFLDVITNNLPLSTHTASILYCVIRK